MGSDMNINAVLYILNFAFVCVYVFSGLKPTSGNIEGNIQT